MGVESDIGLRLLAGKLVLLFPCIRLLRLVDMVEGMEAGTQQVLLGLTSATTHGLDGIHRRYLYNSTFHLFHLYSLLKSLMLV